MYLHAYLFQNVSISHLKYPDSLMQRLLCTAITVETNVSSYSLTDGLLCRGWMFLAIFRYQRWTLWRSSKECNKTNHSLPFITQPSPHIVTNARTTDEETFLCFCDAVNHSVKSWEDRLASSFFNWSVTYFQTLILLGKDDLVVKYSHQQHLHGVRFSWHEISLKKTPKISAKAPKLKLLTLTETKPQTASPQK